MTKGLTALRCMMSLSEFSSARRRRHACARSSSDASRSCGWLPRQIRRCYSKAIVRRREEKSRTTLARERTCRRRRCSDASRFYTGSAPTRRAQRRLGALYRVHQAEAIASGWRTQSACCGAVRPGCLSLLLHRRRPSMAFVSNRRAAIRRELFAPRVGAGHRRLMDELGAGERMQRGHAPIPSRHPVQTAPIISICGSTTGKDRHRLWPSRRW